MRYSIGVMSEIRVVFPERGGVTIHPDRAAIVGRELVTWNVASANPRIRRVKIEFASVDARFFPVEPGPTHRLDKIVDYSRTPPGAPDGRALLWGMAPAFGEADARRERYEIYGLDANGDIVACAAPQLLVDRS